MVSACVGSASACTLFTARTVEGRNPPTVAMVCATMLLVLMLPGPRRSGSPSVIAYG